MRKIPRNIMQAERTMVAYEAKTIMSEKRSFCSAPDCAAAISPAPIQYIPRVMKFIIDWANGKAGAMYLAAEMLLDRSSSFALEYLSD